MERNEDTDHADIEPREAHEMAPSFRAVDGYNRHCAAARNPTVDFQVVFHSQPTRFRPIADDLVNFCSRNSIVGGVWVAQSKARHLCR